VEVVEVVVDHHHNLRQVVQVVVRTIIIVFWVVQLTHLEQEHQIKDILVGKHQEEEQEVVEVVVLVVQVVRVALHRLLLLVDQVAQE
jgi:hypothetical protein